jgi:hypothetical protein
METIQDYVHVEAIEINNSLVDVLLVVALAAVFKRKLGEAVHQPQDLCSKRVVDRNPIFVDNAVLPIDIHHKVPKLGCKDAVFAKNKTYCNRECFQLEIEGVKVLGDCYVILAKDLASLMLLMSPPFVEEYISRSRDLSFSLLLEIAVALLKEKGEKGPGANFCTRVKIPAHMFVDTPSAKTMSPMPASLNSWWSWMSRLPCILLL